MAGTTHARGGVRRSARAWLALPAALALTGCVATRQDVQLLRDDIAAARAEAARGDTLRTRQVDRALAAVVAVQDTVRSLASRLTRYQGDTRDALRTINEQLLQVQELTGQSQRRLQELRASLEARTTEATQTPAPSSEAAESAPRSGADRATTPATRPTTPPRRAPGETAGATPSGTTAGSTSATIAGTSGGATGTVAGAGSAPAGTRPSRSIPVRDTAGATDRAAAERPTNERPTNERPTNERPTNERPTSERPTSERPASERPTATTRASSAGDEAPSSGGPGPNELYQLALDQFRRGSYGTARSGFQELLRRYPMADVAPEAQFYVAEAYAGERNLAAADTAYAAVVKRYPQSARAATALYKRARVAQAAGRRNEARTLYEEVARRYPRSDEAVLARDAVRALSGER